MFADVYLSGHPFFTVWNCAKINLQKIPGAPEKVPFKCLSITVN